MLTNGKLIAFVGVTDRARAKSFYLNVLGLPLISDEPFALVFDVNGTMLRVTPVKQVSVAPYTVLGWAVPDVEAAVSSMEQAGVSFQRYEGIEQDARGIWNAPGGARVAWFKDPDGNLLSISQH